MTSITRRGYGLTKSELGEQELIDLRETFTVKPHSVMIVKDGEEKSFSVYQESKTKIYIPKAYGLKHYGAPKEVKIDEGDDINIEFAGTLRPEQQAPVDAYMKASCDDKKRGGIINLQCAGGKCLGKDTPVMMFDGSIKKVQDIVVGDVIMGDDSTPRNILSTCFGKEMMYKVIPEKGDSYIVNESHILSLKDICDHIVDIPILKYLNLSEDKRESLYGYRVPVDFNVKKVDLDPYVLGYWLGSHNKTEETDIACFLRKYNLVEYKHIPHLYKCNSREVRLKLLAGILDANGLKDDKGLFIYLTDETLIDDVIFLARSLGFTCYKHKRKGDKTLFMTSISGDDLEVIPTKTRLVAIKSKDKKQTGLITSIKLEKLHEDTYFGFEVDGNRRFVLGDFTVTHNTVLALYIIAQIKKKAMIVVHKEFLLDQWKERISQFLPSARVGYIKGPLCDVIDKDIIIGSLQSLSMKEYDASVFAGIAVCVYDEIHHTAAQVFSRIFRKLTTKYSLGLSATVTRKDGLTKVFKWFVGDIVFKGAKKRDNMKVIVKEYYDPCHEYCRELKMFNKQPNMPRMLNNICNFLPRTRFIVQCLKEVLETEGGRKVLILSDRRNHLETFNKVLTENGIESGFYYGGLKQEVLQESEKKQVLLGTYAYVSEGFDLPGLNTMILASPKSDVIQSVGRILRDKPECRQYQALVIDIIDNFSIFPNQGKKRLKYYDSQDYDVHHNKLFNRDEGFKLSGKCFIQDLDEHT